MIALDDYFKLGERVDLIKMDIQGYELHALRGASRVLAESGYKVAFRILALRRETGRSDWVDLIAALEKKSMITRQLTNQGLIPSKPAQKK